MENARSLAMFMTWPICCADITSRIASVGKTNVERMTRSR